MSPRPRLVDLLHAFASLASPLLVVLGATGAVVGSLNWAWSQYFLSRLGSSQSSCTGGTPTPPWWLNGWPDFHLETFHATPPTPFLVICVSLVAVSAALALHTISSGDSKRLPLAVVGLIAAATTFSNVEKRHLSHSRGMVVSTGTCAISLELSPSGEDPNQFATWKSLAEAH
jgi:hypothetical protein